MAKDLASTGRKPWILLISAPSGAGKTTLCQSLLQSDNRFRRLITCTTRPPRIGESDGNDYHILNREAFEQQVDQGEFMEHAVVYDHIYGSR
ncbi:MAG: guanylate kinase, partial [Verrucomicrobiales bacterium]